MRRRAMPISWPRRDPRHYRFAMPNSVWEYKLKPIEFLIFSYLCYRPSTSTLTPDVISAGVHLTTGTVKKYLAALVAKELIGEDGTSILKCKDKNFFTLPNEVFLLRLPPSAFMIYAYLKRVVKDFLILFTEYSKNRHSKSRGPNGSRPAHAPLTRQPSSGGLPRGASA